MQGKITKRFVDGLDKPGKWKCTEVRGFGIKVTPAGKKIYIVENSVRGISAKLTVTIGQHGVWATEQAREEAKRILAMMAQGINPNELKKQKQLEEKHRSEANKALKAQREITLTKVLDDYIRSRGDSLKQTTRYIYRCVVLSSLSDWTDKPIEDISRELVEQRHREISNSRGKGAANHVMRVLRALCNYAMTTYKNYEGHPLLQQNPVKRLSEVKAWNRLERRQGIVKSHELSTWYEAVQKLDHAVVRDFLVFLLFTGLRRNEAARLTWKDVDFKDDTIYVRDPKNRQPYLVPLTPPLRRVIERRKKEALSSDLIFPSTRIGGVIKDLRSDLNKIANETGIKFVLHDLRRTFITIAESLDIPFYAIKRLANHKDRNDVTVGYIISDVERLRKPMRRISDFIETKINADTRLNKIGTIGGRKYPSNSSL